MLLAMNPKSKRIALGVAFSLVILGYALLLWRGPWWIDGAHLRSKNLEPADGVVITGFRTMLVALGAGAVAALGLSYTHKGHKQTEKLFEHTRDRDREQAELVREGQVTDRYVEAIKLLSEKGTTKRLGGIYALERIMKDSEKDHMTVVEVLAAFIREHTPLRASHRKAKGSSPKSGFNGVKPGGAVQAALTVLGRRPIRPEKNRIDLRNSDLRGADLSSAYLVRFNFSGSDLRGADLSASHLHGVNLRDTRLDGACFVESLLDGCFLDGAQGSDVNFNCAILREAGFGEANLSTVDFSGADLWASKWVGSVINGANFESADLRFSVLINTVFGGATFKGACFSLAQVAGSEYPECEFQGADLRGAIVVAGDLSGANGVEPKLFEQAIIGSEVKLPEVLSGDPLIIERLQAYKEVKAFPILRMGAEVPQCCLDDLNHDAGLIPSIPDESERDSLVSEIMDSWTQG
ncbi:pentapeptide repeat-containing protein [Streptomyces bluensis]|uniref:pentapeptide repeat-containing protein n=1 Tax=Streptomyces bluensis TaxID=33897 RepID=UPI0036B18AE9